MILRHGKRPVFWPAALALAPLLLALWLTAGAYWPGLMTWDSVRQYDQASTGQFDDWHPPVMEWIWRQLLPLADGPAPMLVVQTALYGAGFAVMTGWALKQRRPLLACLLGLSALLPVPVALMGTVIKDSLMTGALLSATGLLALPVDRHDRTLRLLPLRALAIMLVLLAATLRFNAFLAGLPLVLALLPAAWRASWRRLGVSAVATSIILLMAMPVANRLIGAQKSGVELSLIIFDLGGITEFSGQNAFPPLPIPDPVAVNHQCYSPVKWDPYSWWVDPICPFTFDRMRSYFHASHVDPYRYWLGQIARHPLAYAEHRLTHWNINARFIVPDEIERAVQVQSAPNDRNFHIDPSRTLAFVDHMALLSAQTPLGWPCFWMALALGTVLAAPRLPSRAIIMPVALSASFYGAGYAVFSVASELRYYLWTIVATAIAACIAATDIAALRRALALRLCALWLGPALTVIILCSLSRQWGW